MAVRQSEFESHPVAGAHAGSTGATGTTAAPTPLEELRDAGEELFQAIDAYGQAFVWGGDVRVGAALGRLRSIVGSEMEKKRQADEKKKHAGDTGATGAAGGHTGLTGAHR
jgi:hypothetical protein